MRVRRVLLHTAWAVPTLFLVLFGVLVAYGGCDVRYVARVLIHRDSNTDDYQWKSSATIAPAAKPRPWPVALDCAPIAAAFAQEPDAPAMDDYLTAGGALGFVVVRSGTIVCEWYGNGGGMTRPAAAFSLSKTVMSLLLARAVEARQLHRLDDPIAIYVPELVARDPRFAAITLANLVDMRSGIAFDESASFPWVNRDSPRVYYATDLARTVLEQTEVESAPGPFVYNDYAPNLNGLALQRATGQRLAAGPMQALWSELGAEYPALWSTDEEGFAYHESGLVTTARDLARVGQLVLDGGRVDGRQVAPTAFLARSLDPAGREPVATFGGPGIGYRNGWWIFDDALVGMGLHGQILVVSPAARVVIVRLGLDGHDERNASIARRLLRVIGRLAPM